MHRLPYLGPTDWPGVLDGIRRRAQGFDISGDWPTIDLQALEATGAMRWSAPKDFGGEELPPLQLHLKYEQLATASLATALILTQRDAAVGLLTASHNASKRSTMLRRLAENKHFATVGIAQLTTSRQGSAPALEATKVTGGYRLNGVIPWCTGAPMAHFIVAGAALDDGRQILFLMEPHLSGVTIDPVMQLVALRSTFTTSLRLTNVMLEERWLLRGPTDGGVLTRPNSLTLGQTFLAMGLCRSAISLMASHDSDRARAAVVRFEAQLDPLRTEVLSLCQAGREPDAAAANARLRGACNDLVLRAAHAAVALFKGSALLPDHPAQRLAREAMFLLVWSCPNPVIDCTIDLLSER